MLTHTLKSAVLGTIVASALMAPITVSAQQDPMKPAPAQPATASKTLDGKITDKAAKSITVDGVKIAVSESTQFTKSGQAIKAGDIKVGDQVRVTLSGDSGAPAAASVEVVSGDSK